MRAIQKHIDIGTSPKPYSAIDTYSAPVHMKLVPQATSLRFRRPCKSGQVVLMEGIACAFKESREEDKVNGVK